MGFWRRSCDVAESMMSWTVGAILALGLVTPEPIFGWISYNEATAPAFHLEWEQIYDPEEDLGVLDESRGAEREGSGRDQEASLAARYDHDV